MTNDTTRLIKIGGDAGSANISKFMRRFNRTFKDDINDPSRYIPQLFFNYKQPIGVKFK
jgi:hypothetical protein